MLYAKDRVGRRRRRGIVVRQLPNPIQRLQQVLRGEALDEYIFIQVRRGQDEVFDLQRFDGRLSFRLKFDVQLAQGADGHVGAATVSDQVDALHLRTSGDGADEVLQVENGELARLAVVSIAAQIGEARGPSVGDGHADAAEEMPDLGGA